ncbi:MAG: InlB B-repeat-containing protein, partial [Pseudodesulfovibrio sp.]|nr:InlB B-repeat-containing protein [Pseudodesulfovibrio sp.]
MQTNRGTRLARMTSLLVALGAFALLFTTCNNSLLAPMIEDVKENEGKDWSYTVTFDSGNADTSADPATKIVAKPATTVKDLPTAPVRTGYSFGGWWTELDGGGVAFTGSTPVTGNMTVYAKWTADATVSLLAIPDIVAPVRGEAPVTTAIDRVQYTGSITWDPVVDTFAASTVYTATIALTAKAGWTLNGVAENSFTVAGATTVTHSAGSGVVTAVFPATGLLSDIDVTFSSVIQVGGTSNSVSTTSLTLTFSVDPGSLTADLITVTGTTKGALTGTGTTRSLTISDITVANGEKVSVTVASPAGYAISGSPQEVVVYKAPTTIDVLAIPGVTAPVTGATPVTTITETDQYTGTVSWSDSPTKFAAYTVYTATIVLTAKEGFTFEGVAANSFAVADANPVTYQINSGIVVAQFTRTAAVINIAAIPGVTVPVLGATPVTAITETDQYT